MKLIGIMSIWIVMLIIIAGTIFLDLESDRDSNHSQKENVAHETYSEYQQKLDAIPDEHKLEVILH